jgi:Domain of unknown function (DUF4173)
VRFAALAAALAAAALLPGQPLGVGVTLVFLLVAIAAASAARPTLDVLLFGGLAVTLAALPTIRDATWVVSLDLAGAWLLATVAVSGPALVSAFAPVVRLERLRELSPPVPSGASPVLRGTALGGALLTPFGVLFWTADAAFAELGQRLPLPSFASLPGRVFAGAFVFLAAAGLALTARRPLSARMRRIPGKLTAWEWGIPLALLNALFLAFVLVQLTVLFGGHEHVLRTSGLTYAEYARAGFWQLLAAAALTLAVIGAAVLFAATPRRADRVLLRLLLGLLCALTIVVVVSALRRLQLYEDAFGLTRLRLLAETGALWFGGVFALLIAAGSLARVREQLPRIAITGTAVALLVFSLLNPDGRIAERNVERWRDTGRIDLSYTRTLSADATPALAELPPELARNVLSPVAARLAEGEPWSSFNFSRARARDVIVKCAAVKWRAGIERAPGPGLQGAACGSA